MRASQAVLLLALVCAASAAAAARPHATAAAAAAGVHQQRKLAQILPPIVKLAPCNAEAEHTCSGAAGTADICCVKRNFRCATRLDTGGPRCAMCPTLCPQCSPGYTCGLDENG